MIQEIKYNGYSASPSDYQSLDGDMASMLNCIPHRGALRPILPPETVEHFGDKIVMAVHKIADFEVYILNGLTEDILYWRKVDDKDGEYTLLHDFTEEAALTVTPIGNTLAVLDGNGVIHYFLWKTDAYTNLGTQLPELEAKPYISSQIYDNTDMDNIYGIEFTEKSPSTILSNLNGSTGLLNPDETKALYDAKTTNIPLYGEVRQNVYNKVFAKINQVERLLKQKGFFTAPFFVRFAYRLFDGSHAMHTTPTLMVPTTWGAPLTSVRVLSTGRVDFNPLVSASKLTAEIITPDNLSDWADVITHIDVFVTPQAINYTDSPEALVSLSQLPFAKYNNETQKWSFDSAGAPQIMDNDKQWRSIVDIFTVESTDDFDLLSTKSVKDGGQYIFDTIDYKSGFLAVDISTGDGRLTLTSGLTLELLDNPPALPLPEGGQYKVYFFYGKSTVIYNGPETTVRAYGTNKSTSAFTDTTHHYIELRRTDGKDFADVIAEYNNFYKVGEIDVKLNPNGFTGTVPLKKDVLVSLVTHETLPDTGQGRTLNIISNQFSYNNRLNVIVQGENLPPCAALTAQNPTRGDMSNYTIESAYVKVIENSQTSYIRVKDERAQVGDLKLVYFAYPRSTATELQIYYTDNLGQPYVRTIQLTRHPFLNLAYAFNKFEAIEGNFTECSTIPNHLQTSIIYGNKIKTSDVNNPFIFSEENTSELPVGKIYALSTAAKALSQGQFGQFPLYAFTDKGVWALEVTGTGTYSARQPITRDVVLNPESVTQIDDAVLFATRRGIMLLAGSQVQCISEVLDGTAFDITQLEFAHKKISEDSTALSIVSWDTYKTNIEMLYDYTGQRIIVFNPWYGYSYVFSLDSKQWGIMKSNIKSTVDYYPQAYAMTNDGTLVDYSVTDGSEAKGHYITRPLKLDAPDVHKTITGIIQRGQFKKGHVNTMLYGSRDLDKWYPVYGSNDHILRGMRGTPYKYFRIASTFRLDKDESITGCSVDYEPRLNNKLR